MLFQILTSTRNFKSVCFRQFQYVLSITVSFVEQGEERETFLVLKKINCRGREGFIYSLEEFGGFWEQDEYGLTMKPRLTCSLMAIQYYIVFSQVSNTIPYVRLCYLLGIVTDTKLKVYFNSSIHPTSFICKH